jgi:adenylate kinase
MILVFIGPPGAGKGTQASRLADHFQIVHLSTGDILRAAKSQGTELGKIVAPIMDSGGLVSDELMVQVVRERITNDDCAGGFLLDGFPRTLPQARALDEMLEGRKKKIDAAVELCVSDDELTKRLLNRYHQLANPRPDDLPEAIPTRIMLYKTETAPLTDYYKKQNLLVAVDGVGTLDEVFERIVDGLSPIQSN